MKQRLIHHFRIIAVLVTILLNQHLYANELSGDNVLILYKKLDSLSKQTALYYAEKRQIPDNQIVPVDIVSHAQSISRAKFADLQQQIQPYLTDKIKVIVMAWHAPYKVECMSITSAMTLGFDEKYCSHHSLLPKGCRQTAISPFFNANQESLWQNDKLRLSIMLSGQDFEQVKALIDKGVAADNTQPEGEGFLVRTQDEARSTRAETFERLVELWPAQKGIKLNYVDDSRRHGTSVHDKKRVMFYFTGLVNVPDIQTNNYLPGAIADHLTSYGGAGIGLNGQMKLYRWLEAGVTGSYGTVVEPCAYPEKFPNPMILIPSYMSGDTLIEAYWKSVQQPGEGIFAGEPLARPWAN